MVKPHSSGGIGEHPFVKRRAVIYHEGGTMLILNGILFFLLITLGCWSLYLSTRERVYSVPGIFNQQDLDVKWGTHAP